MSSNWQNKALCKGHDRPSIWFSYNKEELEEATNICKQCPVAKQCFLNAWESEDFYGVRGGITEYEYLEITWKEAKSGKQGNRTRSDKLLKAIMQRFK